jgi:AcrR family transcriptional regulator
MSAKQKILTCALEELERSGVEGFSLRAVGAAAGYTPMAIYRHYRNREELLAAVGEEAFAAWQRRVGAIRAAGALDWLRLSARAYIEFALDEPARFDACFVLKTHAERLYPDDFAAGRSPVISLVMQHIAVAQVQGQLAKGDPLELALLLWAELHGLAMLHRSGRFAMERAAFLDLCARCTDLVLIDAPHADPPRSDTRRQR